MIPGLPHLLPQLPCHQWQHLLSGNPNKIYQVKWVNSTQIQEWKKSQYLFSPGILLKTVNNIQNRYWKSCRRKSKVIRANIDKKSEQQVSADCSKARFRDRERRNDQLFNLQSCLFWAWSKPSCHLPGGGGHLKIHGGEKSNQVSSC